MFVRGSASNEKNCQALLGMASPSLAIRCRNREPSSDRRAHALTRADRRATPARRAVIGSARTTSADRRRRHLLVPAPRQCMLANDRIEGWVFFKTSKTRAHRQDVSRAFPESRGRRRPELSTACYAPASRLWAAKCACVDEGNGELQDVFFKLNCSRAHQRGGSLRKSRSRWKSATRPRARGWQRSSSSTRRLDDNESTSRSQTNSSHVSRHEMRPLYRDRDGARHKRLRNAGVSLVRIAPRDAVNNLVALVRRPAHVARHH